MRVLSLVNFRGQLRPDQSTTALALESARRGGTSWIAGIDDVSLDGDGAVVFDALPMRPAADAATALDALAGAESEPVRDTGLDAILIRTNPGRDKERTGLHEATLNLCRLAQSHGVAVLNDPDALPRASDKLYLAYLPEALRPRMVVTRDGARIRAFVEEEKERSVLKPLFGTQGRGVFRVSPGGPNLRALIDVLTSDGYVIAQQYLRRAPEGDTRIVIVDGAPLEVDGKICAVRRVPSGKEFRSNIHLGGRAQPAEPTPPLIRAAGAIGEVLAEHGIWMAGVDLVGTKAVEVNVRSPGGLTDATEFEGVDFVAAAVDSIARRIKASGS